MSKRPHSKRHSYKKSKRQLFNQLLVLFFLIGIILGFFLYSKLSFFKKINSELKPTQSQSAEETLLNPPINGTEEQKKAHFDLVLKLAQLTDKIDLIKCKANPPAIKISLGKSFQIKNSDNLQHIIIFGPEQKYTIQPNESILIKTSDFKNGLAIYGFACENSAQTAGIIFLIP